jgi:uncharacterized membrane protein
MNYHLLKVRRLLASITFWMVLGCLLVATAEACPTCKDNIAGDPTAEGLARGFYYSILFMVSMPFFILGSLCAYFYFLVRRAEWEKQQLAADATTVQASPSAS